MGGKAEVDVLMWPESGGLTIVLEDNIGATERRNDALAGNPFSLSLSSHTYVLAVRAT